MIKIKFLLNFLIILIILIIFFLSTNNNLHPITLIILLLFYTSMTCLIISIWKDNFIFSIIIFLIIIRGLLIIFLYFSSLISNEQFKFSIKFFPITIIILNIIIIIYLSPLFLSNLCSSSQPPETKNLSYINQPLFYNVTKIYLYPYNNLTIICILFLLISLFLIIKICSIKSSSLRKIS